MWPRGRQVCRGEAGEAAGGAGAPPRARCPQLCLCPPALAQSYMWPISRCLAKGSAVLRQSSGSVGGV